MKKYVLMSGLALISTLLWAAQTTIDVPVVLNGSDSIQRINVPAAILAASQKEDYQDIQILDATGRAMLMAWSRSEHVTLPETHQTFSAFPIMAQQALPEGQANLRIVQTDGVRIVELSNAPKTGQQVIGALFDTRSLPADLSIQTIEFDVDLPIGQPVNLSMASSENLSDWYTISDDATIAQFKNDDGNLQQHKISLPPTVLHQRYLRMTWDPSVKITLRQITLSGVASKFVQKNEELPLALPKDFSPNNSKLEWFLPHRLQIEGISVRTSQENTLIPIKMSYQTNSQSVWSRLGSGVLFRLNRNGVVQSNADFLESASLNALQLESDAKSAWPQDLKVSILIKPLSAVFVASGQAPYHLVAGYDKATQARMENVNTLIPDYQHGDEYKLPLATLNAIPETPLMSSSASYAKAYGLWAALAGGVVLLGIMVFVIVRQMKHKP